MKRRHTDHPIPVFLVDLVIATVASFTLAVLIALYFFYKG